jgi:hypothetical protein
MENKSNFIFEAKQISNYLLPVPVRDSEKETYADAMQKLDIKFSKYEQALWKNMLKSKWRMACIDAGLALKQPNNNVRRKLFTMLAILEASPNYTSYFLSQNFSFFYVFKLFFVGVRAVLRAIIGLIIVNSIQRKCS